MYNIYLIISLVILIITGFEVKKHYNDTKKIISIMLLGMAISLAVLVFPINNEKSLLGKVVFSIVYSAQTVILNENFDLVHQIQTIGVIENIYVGVIYILSLLMPLLTVSFLLTLIDEFASRFKLFCLKKNNLLIFSEANEKSLFIAKRMKNNKNTMLFVNCKDDGKNFVKEIKNLKGVRINLPLEELDIKKIRNTKITIYIVSDNEDKNLDLTLKMIKKNKNTEKYLKIYSILNSDISRIVLDSTDKGNVQVEIVNEIERTILQLLNDKPLYLKAIDNKISVLIVGCGKVGLQFLKTVTWCGQIIGYDLDINVIDIKANQIKEKLEVECPELMKNYNYNFIEADIESKKAIDELKKLKYINYVLVALNTDEVNIKEAIFLRRFYICQDKENFERKPIINLWIENEEKNKQVVILKNEKATQYEFNAFGSSYQLYYENPIINSRIEKIAQKIHLSWSPNDTMLKEYYKNEYNIRSSRAAALHITYKIYSVLRENYTGNTEYDINSFEEIIKNENVLRELTQNEHNRWNAYMRSDGFKKADMKDVEKYYNTVNDYKNHLAKLHPAIVDNEELKIVEKKLGKDLIKIDEDMIKSISNYLKI